MKVGSGLAQGRDADPALAAAAVKSALQRAKLTQAQAVLLYLSDAFAQDPQPAITAAARAASCLQVAGCSAVGLFTDEDWVLDAAAAAVLVLGDGPNLAPAREDAAPVLTFAAPSALDLHWLMGGGPRFGGVSGNAAGRGPYTVWAGARVRESGRAELVLEGARMQVGVTQGVRPLTRPAPIGQVDGQELRRIGGEAALTSLVRELPLGVRAPDRIPIHLLLAGVTYGEPEHALEDGRYHLTPVIEIHPQERSVSIADRLEPGRDLFWALRQPQAAEHDLRAMLGRLTRGETGKPRFGLLFPSIGRGPVFYGGIDRDLRVLRETFPRMPFIGFYGNGEIAHLDGANRLLQYSAVLGLGFDPSK